MFIYTQLFKRRIYPCPSLVRENPLVKHQYEDFGVLYLGNLGQTKRHCMLIPLNPIIKHLLLYNILTLTGSYFTI